MKFANFYENPQHVAKSGEFTEFLQKFARCLLIFSACIDSSNPKFSADIVKALNLLHDFYKIAFTIGESTPPERKDPIGTSECM